MNFIDIGISIIIIVSLFIGMLRGFIKEILSFFTWLLAFFLAYHYSTYGGIFLEPYLNQSLSLRIVAAFVIIFVVSLLLISTLSYLFYRCLTLSGISGVDRSLGTLFGIVRGIIIVALLSIGANFFGFTNQLSWKQSIFINYFFPITKFIYSMMPNDIDELNQDKIGD